LYVLGHGTSPDPSLVLGHKRHVLGSVLIHVLGYVLYVLGHGTSPDPSLVLGHKRHVLGSVFHQVLGNPFHVLEHLIVRVNKMK
jgi:hypothetical protein